MTNSASLGGDRGVACFGELLVRLGAPSGELLLQSSQLNAHFGGAEANVAIGLAALGHAPRMISRVADNGLGDAAIGNLRRYGVDTGGVLRAPGRMGLYFLTQGAGLRASEVLYDREGSSFSLAAHADFDWPRLLDGIGLLHMSGITPALGPELASIAIAAAHATAALGVTLAFDVNYRSKLWKRWHGDPRAIIGEIVARTDILFGNHHDLSLLLGRTFDGDGEAMRRDAANRAFEAYPKLKYIASTARRVQDSDCHYIAARIDTPLTAAATEELRVSGIVDRIGAGDAFAAGVLHGLRTGLDLDATLRCGHVLTCLKHSLAGDASVLGLGDLRASSTGLGDIRR